jgi:hypothetical protein
MDLNNVMQKWKEFISQMNQRGVPVPMARYKGEGNPALTVFVVSSVLVTAGIVGKWAGHLGGIDMNNAMQFFYASSTLFFSHSWVHKDSKGSDTLTSGDDQK